MSAGENIANASFSTNGDSRSNGSWLMFEPEVLTLRTMEEMNERSEESKDQECCCEEVRCNIAKQNPPH